MSRRSGSVWRSKYVLLASALGAAGLMVWSARGGLEAQSWRDTSPPAGEQVDVTVSEGTSMAVAVSPDGQTLAIDLQGTIWGLPASGGAARPLSDPFFDARQPSWSPDGRRLAFQGYRDGTYDVWVMSAEGSSPEQLTWGPDDDREPVWSHDGTRLAFASDRSGNYDIWILTVATGELAQVTRGQTNDYMPTWSPDDREIAFVSAAGNATTLKIASLEGVEREVAGVSGRIDAPSWGPDGRIVYHVTDGERSQYAIEGQVITGDENVFPFRAQWVSPSEIVYTADGRIRRRALGGDVRTIEFSATLPVTRTAYERRPYDFDARDPQRALGIVGPAIAPDGRQVAFAALGDIWTMRIGEAPQRVTDDAYLDTDPAWSPDGRQLLYSSDRAGNLDLWIRDLESGRDRQLTTLPTAERGGAWSPDGSRVAFIGGNGPWRGEVGVVGVESGQVRTIHDTLFGPGYPSWSPDGRLVALAGLQQHSSRFREGTNQIMTIPVDGGEARYYRLEPHLSIDSRVGAGPVWSPDGTRMAVVVEGLLAVVPVSRDGRPLGPARRVTSDMAHAPSWTADSKTLLYLSMDRLQTVSLADGSSRDVPLDLTWRQDVPEGRLVVHAGRLVDGLAEQARSNVDVVIRNNRIEAIEPHRDDLHAGTVVDAGASTVMPGLVEFHTHLLKEYGEKMGRAFLSYGITTVRNPGGTPYETVEDREAVAAGVRPGPRVFSTGYLLEWNRAYYPMAVAVSSGAHLEMELERASRLRHDLVKSYVRMPDLFQRRIVEFAHGIGIPVATHEIYPAAYVGVDHTEHTSGTSRRGYSPKVASLAKTHDDVVQLLAASGMTVTPTVALGGFRRILETDPGVLTDPRFDLFPEWVTGPLRNPRAATGGFQIPASFMRNSGEMVLAVQRAGGRVVAGTDSPFMPYGISLHGELESYVEAGMTPFEALRTATSNPAEALGLGDQIGTLEAGKLADLAIVDGDPLADISNARNVRQVIANGRLFEVADLVRAPAASGTAAR